MAGSGGGGGTWQDQSSDHGISGAGYQGIVIVRYVAVDDAVVRYEVDAAIQTGSVSVFTYASDVLAESGRYVAAADEIVRYEPRVETSDEVET